MCSVLTSCSRKRMPCSRREALEQHYRTSFAPKRQGIQQLLHHKLSVSSLPQYRRVRGTSTIHWTTTRKPRHPALAAR
jgi:hypothetical protein